jgi:sulfite reductase (ferredoxin)
LPEAVEYPPIEIANPFRYEQWLATNVFEQKQEGFFGVFIKVPVGDIPTDVARKLVAAIRPYVGDEIRITQNQGLLLKFIRKEALPALYEGLNALDFRSTRL